MSCYLQIEGDPTKWWIQDQVPANELTAGQPLTVTSLAPIEGILVLSPRSATAAVSDVPAGSPPAPLATPGGLFTCRPRPGRPPDTSGTRWRAGSTRLACPARSPGRCTPASA